MIKTKLKSRCVNEIAFKTEFVRVSRTQAMTAIARAGARPGSHSRLLPPDGAAPRQMLEVRPNQNVGLDGPATVFAKQVCLP